MKSSQQKKERRRFLDVVKREDSGIVQRFKKLIGWQTVINLRPASYRRYPLWTITLIAFIVFVTFWGRQFFISAESATFYPATCLGTWENDQHAQGEPESVASSSVFIKEENAALYPGGNEQIFCGKFISDDFKPIGALTGVGLTLAWQIGEATIPPGQEGIIIVPTESASSSESSSTAVPSDATGTPIMSPQPEEGSTTSSTNQTTTIAEPTSFLPSWLIFPAFAQEADGNGGATVEPPASISPEPSPPVSAPTPVEPSPAEPPTEPKPSPTEGELGKPSPFSKELGKPTDQSTQNEAVAEPLPESKSEVPSVESAASSTEGEKVIPLGPPITATLEEVATSSEVASSSASTTLPEVVSLTEVAMVPPPPDEHFLAVKYSLDGSSWELLGLISDKNWRLFTVSLPVRTWEELKRLQIMIEGVPTSLSNKPPVLLDGMFIEARYDVSMVEKPLDEAELIAKEKQKLAEAPFPSLSGPEEMYASQKELGEVLKADVLVSRQFQSGEWLSFKKQEGSSYDVYLQNRMSGEIRRLTDTSSTESEPVISGDWVAWTYVEPIKEGEAYHGGEIYVYNISSSTVERLTDDGFIDELPNFYDQGRVLRWRKEDARAAHHTFSYSFELREIKQEGLAIFSKVPEEISPQ